MAGGGGLARVYVADDNNIDVGLFFGHFGVQQVLAAL